MISRFEVQETNKMIQEANLDIRTITMGISLLDCISGDMDKLCENIYNKITTCAKDLVLVGEQISKKYGIPIVNKRISVTPIALVAGATKATSYVPIAKTLDRAAEAAGVNFIGGFSALVQKGMSPADRESIGCAKFVVFCNAPDDNPFMAGAFHGVGEHDTVINVGVSGPGVVKKALEQVREADFETLCETVKRTAFKITRAGQMVAEEASKMLGVPFGIIDLSLAPTPAIGDSIAEIFEEMGLEMAGAPGTTAALAILNDSVKKGGVMASSCVGGLSGAFIPVSEDHAMIKAAEAGALTLEKLEAMTCVCSVGLDMVAIPGDTSAKTISGIIADEMAIGMINAKTTAVRIIPVQGKGVGECVEFGGLLGRAPIMPINSYNCDRFIDRGGRIPAPIHSFKN